MSKEKLITFLCDAGCGSRRECEDYIKSGRVKVNGEVIKKLSYEIDPKKDIITLDEERVRKKEDIYIAFYKPKMCLVTSFDPLNRPKVYDFLPLFEKKVYPVGKMDYHSEGLLILTSDRKLIKDILSKDNIEKVYEVKIKGEAEEKLIRKLRKGIPIEKEKIKCDRVSFIRKTKKGNSWLEISVATWSIRKLKLLFLYLKHPVMKLKRVKIANIELLDLNPKEFRFLTKKEIKILKNLIKS